MVSGCTIFARPSFPLWRRVWVRDYPTLSCWQSSSAEKHSVTPSRLFFIVPDSALEKSCSVLTTWSPLSLSRAVFLTTPPRSVASAAKWRSTCATRSSRYRSSETNLYQCMQEAHLYVYWSCTELYCQYFDVFLIPNL